MTAPDLSMTAPHPSGSPNDPAMAVIAPNFPPKLGGIESYISGLAASAWPRSTTVFAPPAPGSGDWDAAAAYRVERRRLVGTLPPRWLPARPLVARLERETDIVLYAEWWPAARAAAVGPDGRRRRALRALVVYGTEVVAARGRADAALRRAVRAMDLVIAISTYTADQVSSRVPGCPPVAVLNPGVDTEPARADPASTRAELGLGPGPIVLTAARLVPRKGHAEFAAHWPSVRARVPGAEWVVVGDGPVAGDLKRASVPGMRLLGPVERSTLMALYSLADVHVLPGLRSPEVEGFGMAIVEAGAAGTPSVASDLGGTSEALGGGGVLVPGGDMAAVAAATAELLLDGTRRRRLGEQARRRAEDVSWDRIGARFRGIVGHRLAAAR